MVKDPRLSVTTPDTSLPFGVPARYWLSLRGYNPPKEAKSLKQPILILQGERDYQVTMKDFERWMAALSSRKNVEFKAYPKLNHLFIEGDGKSSPDEYQTPGHVAEIVINDIANWIKGL
ncbi:MAG: prolyl oligopeptidase family serine peptidase [Candidatus Krumholzibacteria bacterium]|nr:prolyl oligopeptidase family serine peptidase [Candidatus Krumholzibacteria bacterium]